MPALMRGATNSCSLDSFRDSRAAGLSCHDPHAIDYNEEINCGYQTKTTEKDAKKNSQENNLLS